MTLRDEFAEFIEEYGFSDVTFDAWVEDVVGELRADNQVMQEQLTASNVTIADLRLQIASRDNTIAMLEDQVRHGRSCRECRSAT